MSVIHVVMYMYRGGLFTERYIEIIWGLEVTALPSDIYSEIVNCICT